ncbi:YtfJ family protein [Vibrio sp. ABG19]|uniref:YtfJ family protein n=1 Tax=Vibrio sp. ABG19 TaxID=2817385 RepID=UPI00249F4593|nr:YtfJ family protein [Vibrio sp. ABG19]WGY47981.1 YtfJ family protein [Vibrio sp. ABG19]
MKNKTLIAILLACSPTLVSAHNLHIGQTLPEVSVQQYGEVILNNNDTIFQSWNSQQMVGKVRVIQAIAGRSSAKELNQQLMSAISAAKFPAEQYQTTSIINQDDAIWGTGSFVKSSAQDSKKEYPWSSIVLDEDGNVARSWALQPESSAIIVQDKRGQILFVHEGALDDSQIEQVLQLVQRNL